VSVNEQRQPGQQPPQLIQARVTKLVTEDGLLRLTKDVRIGDVFLVDIYTRSTTVLLNKEKQELHEKEVIQCFDDGGWLAMECIELFV
jgi:hypothetical protein